MMHNNINIYRRIITFVIILLAGLSVSYFSSRFSRVQAIPKPTFVIVVPSPQPTAPIYGSDNPIPSPIPEARTEDSLPPYPAPEAPTGMPFHPPDSSVPFVTAIVPTPTLDASSQLKLPLNQADAINRAIAIAPEYGIDLPKPSKILAEQMTLGAWDKLAGNMPGPEGAKFGLDPNQLVWVVTLIGDGFWAESVPSSQGGDKIDNITMVISAATGKHIETRVLAPADSLPFGN